MELPTSQVVVSSKMSHGCSQMIWLLKLTKAKYQSFQFQALEKYGQIKHEEMFEIFNMGIGLMLAVKPENVERVKELLDEPVYEIGRIVKKTDASVVIK